jgi:hypothetical protein
MLMGLWQKQGVVEVSRMKKGLKLSKARESTAGATKPHCKHTHTYTAAAAAAAASTRLDNIDSAGLQAAIELGGDRR